MSQYRKELADLLRPRLVPPGFGDQVFLRRFDEILDSAGVPRDEATPSRPSPSQQPDRAAGGAITARVALEIVTHEAIVLEAYRDSVGVWTWGVGVTEASGHAVGRYRDAPQTVAHVVKVFAWLLREKYLPPVLRAFDGFPLTEAQTAAALSFHYNTGAIGRASWVGLAKAGRTEAAKTSFMEWRKPPEIVERRRKERDLFFEGKWSQTGKVLILPVSKPSYHPNFRAGRSIDITADLAAAFAS